MIWDAIEMPMRKQQERDRERGRERAREAYAKNQ